MLQMTRVCRGKLLSYHHGLRSCFKSDSQLEALATLAKLSAEDKSRETQGSFSYSTLTSCEGTGNLHRNKSSLENHMELVVSHYPTSKGAFLRALSSLSRCHSSDKAASPRISHGPKSTSNFHVCKILFKSVTLMPSC